jgi:SAM-dependent methyltransferase
VPVDHPVDEQARAFWEEHSHISEDHTYWMADPRCREAINRRVSGDPGAWPLIAFQRYIGRRFRRGLSLGSGLGNLERAVRQMDLCEEVEGVDSSEAALEAARSKAREEGLTGITYRRGDLNTLALPVARYDVVFFHASLHHVRSVEKLLARVERAMTPDGILFLEEWVGPSRTEWDENRLARMRALYAELPESWRVFPTLQAPIAVDDPSEAARSSAILPAVRRLFHVLEERPYGGHLVAVILSQLVHDAVPEAERQALAQRLLALEDADLAKDPSCSFHTVVVARRKRRGRIAGHVRTLFVRLGLAARYRAPRAWRSIMKAS